MVRRRTVFLTSLEWGVTGILLVLEHRFTGDSAAGARGILDAALFTNILNSKHQKQLSRDQS